MTLAAYYYPASKAERAKGAAGRLELHTIGPAFARLGAIRTIPCADKREARSLAAAHNAKPWNF